MAALLLSLLNEYPEGTVFEFGHVTQHYGIGAPDVIVDLSSPTTFDLIVSISTIEHVGWFGWLRSESKAREALDRLMPLLSSGGKMFFTAPTGYDPHLVEIVKEGIPNTRL